MKIRALLQQYGANDSLSHSRRAAIRQVIFFRIRGRRLRTVRWVRWCLASSDPVGDPDSWDAAIEQWMQARSCGCSAALSVSEAVRAPITVTVDYSDG